MSSGVALFFEQHPVTLDGKMQGVAGFALPLGSRYTHPETGCWSEVRIPFSTSVEPARQ